MSAGEANDGAIISHAAPHTRMGGHAAANPLKQLFLDKRQTATTISGFWLSLAADECLEALVSFGRAVFFSPQKAESIRGLDRRRLNPAPNRYSRNLCLRRWPITTLYNLKIGTFWR